MKNKICNKINLKDLSTVYNSNIYGKFVIIKDLGMINKSHKVIIKFIDTGFENEVQLNQVKYGSVRDFSIFPIVDKFMRYNNRI